MAVTYLPRQSGLFTAAGTWSVCNAASEVDSRAANAVVPTAGGATSDGATMTPAAITADGIAINLAAVAGATGTITVVLRNSVLAADVAGTSVTINIADLPQIGSTVTPGGWVFFKWSAPVLLLAATLYLVRITRSVGSSSVSCYSSSGNAWSQQLRVSGASGAAPAVGDKLIVAGEKTGAGTSNTLTVTYDNTATTIWGASAAGNAIAVCANGILEQQVTSGIAYVLNYLGTFEVVGGGIWRNNGGTAMPSTSSLTVTSQNVANVDCGLELRALGTRSLVGATVTTTQTKLTSGVGGLCSTTSAANSVVTGLEGQSFTGLTGTIVINGVSQTILVVTDATHLTINANAGALSTVVWTHAGTGNVLKVGSTAGWATNDVLCLASTTRTPGDCESVTISTVDSSTQVTLTAAVTKYHSADTSPNDIRAEVGHLTRNIKIQGLSSTLGSYVNIHATFTDTMRYVEHTKLGSATALKRGIDVGTTTGSFDMQFCSIHDCTVTSSVGVNLSSSTTTNFTFSNNVTFNVANVHIQTGQATNNVETVAITVDNNLCIRNTDNAVMIFIQPNLTSLTNCVVAGGVNSGISFNVSGNGGHATGATMSGLTAHSNTGTGVLAAAATPGSLNITTINTWRNASGIGPQNLGGTSIWSSVTSFGHSTQHILSTIAISGRFVISNSDFRAGANLTCPMGMQTANGGRIVGLVFESTVFGGGGQTHSIADLLGNNSAVEFVQITCLNCTFNSTTLIANQSGSIGQYSFVSSQRHNTTAGSHRFYTGEGTGTTDTAIFEAPSTMSLRITPIASANPTLRAAESAPPGYGFQVPVKNGNAVTLTVRVRKSVIGDAGGAAWNGNQPRLYVRRNVAAGITSDTLLATAVAANGSWETLTGTTAAVTDDSTLEFFVDSGVGVASPAGWMNVGLWAVTAGAYYGSLGLEQVYFNGFPVAGMSAGAVAAQQHMICGQGVY